MLVLVGYLLLGIWRTDHLQFYFGGHGVGFLGGLCTFWQFEISSDEAFRKEHRLQELVKHAWWSDYSLAYFVRYRARMASDAQSKIHLIQNSLFSKLLGRLHPSRSQPAGRGAGNEDDP
jgi:hypothetical protein